jgi:hypothetical protein
MGATIQGALRYAQLERGFKQSIISRRVGIYALCKMCTLKAEHRNVLDRMTLGVGT